jgi:hypothetical protein
MKNSIVCIPISELESLGCIKINYMANMANPNSIIMKKSALLLSIALLVVTKISVAQLVADAGPDQVYCNWFDTTYIVLGGNPAASGGVEPYTYMWNVDHPWGIEVFINDPALANPLMLYPPPVGQSIWQLYLTVTDAEQNVSIDTIEVVFSEFVMNLGHYIFTIDLGDTICFPEPNTFGGFPPQEYLWRPNHGLIDSIGWSMCAAPEFTTNYYVVLTDSVGCVINGFPFVKVIVNPVNIDEKAAPDKRVSLYPNPASDAIQIEIDKEIPGNFTLTLHNHLGQQVLSKELGDHLAVVNLQGISHGIYFCRITNYKDFEYVEKNQIK